jgi:hypothetical protein
LLQYADLSSQKYEVNAPKPNEKIYKESPLIDLSFSINYATKYGLKRPDIDGLIDMYVGKLLKALDHQEIT